MSTRCTGSRPQSLVFRRSRFSPSTAKAWAKAHGFRYGKVDVQANTIRLRQFDPGECCRSGGMVPFGKGTGVQAYVCPRQAELAGLDDADLGAARAFQVGTKDPAVMTAGEINKEMERLSAESSRITQEFIDAGRGEERPSDWWHKTDPLSMRHKVVSDRVDKIRYEIERRMGPRWYSPLPASARPIKLRW